MNTNGRVRMVKIADLELHPQADLIPFIRGKARAELKEDINDRGIKVPIETAPGTNRILDGRHRWQIANELYQEDDENENFLDGCVPVVDAELNGEDELAYMVKSAMLRRHMTKEQRADLAVRWMKEQEGTTKKKLSESGRTGGKGNKKPKGLAKTTKPFDRRKEASELYDVPINQIKKAKKRMDQTEQEETTEPDKPKTKKIMIELSIKDYERCADATGSDRPREIKKWGRRQLMKGAKK